MNKECDHNGSECKKCGVKLYTEGYVYSREVIAKKQGRKEREKEVKETIEKCGQMTGNAIRNNVNSSGREFYIQVKELKQKLAAAYKRKRDE